MSKKHKQTPIKRILTPTQTHDVWDIPESEDITEEVTKVLKTFGLDTEEVARAYTGTEKKGAPDG
jgi:hypothetical protein|tara:strand:- start:302 stop:496 length:195 start_codon:yes stop_codon:yes gene_type:complete